MGIFRSCCVAWVLLLSATSAEAMRLVEPGEPPELDAGEGLVVVAVDTNVPLHSVTVNKDGRFFGSGTLRDIEEGITYRLYVAEAGSYEWRKLKSYERLHFELEEDPEFTFRVEAGRITYPGDLLFRPVTFYSAEIALPNRLLAAMDWLSRAHPGVLEGREFAYAGHYPDPFPAHYRKVLAANPGFVPEDTAKLLPPPAPGDLPLSVESLWQPGRVTDIAMNPAGNLVAMQVRLSIKERIAMLGESYAWAVDLADMEAGSITRIAHSDVPYDALQWSGDDALLLSLDALGTQQVSVLRASRGADGKRSFRHWAIPTEGFVLDPLAHDPDHMLLGHVTERGELRVHQVDISSRAATEAFDPRMRNRLNVGVDNDVQWFTDGAGQLRMAVAERDDDYVLMHWRGGQFHEVQGLSDTMGFEPLGLSYDAGVVYGLTDEDRDQRDLVAFDVAQARIVETLFSRPGVDVVSMLQDERRRPIGVMHYDEGRLVSTYFDESDQRVARLLAQAFPGKTVAVVDRSRDGRRSVLWVDAGDQPAQLYHLDADKGSAMLLDESMPWLADVAFAPTAVVPFQGSDGLAMEAFLTLPPGQGKRPLVVMPHGGPVGVADRRHFDPEVQFLASLGYAVLRVNFRGSEGYGRAFREAGYRSFGTLIEDDIDAAIDKVVATQPVDGSRMCVVGASYGGYSALVGAMRWPDRFRCVVSIAGVSDRILQFTASDSGRSAEGRELLEKLMGDPRTDQDAMMATSPLYHHDAIKVPVMLVHGLEDRRVDFEHARRMARMLEIAGRPATGLVFEDEGHGFADQDNLRALWEGVAGFLRKHMGPVPATPQG